MTITREKISADVERKLALGMVTNAHFLRDVIPILDARLLQVPYIRTLAAWCSEHWQTYQEPPGLQQIRDVFAKALRRGKIPDNEHELLEDFLDGLKTDDSYNAEFWLDEVERYLDSQRLQMVSEDALALLSTGDLEGARQCHGDYVQVHRPGGSAVNPFDGNIIETAFEDAQDPLFTMPGALGEFMNHLLVRQSLVMIMAPEKRGKSFWLQEIALRAAMSRQNVVFFAVGDMTRDQMVRRIGVGLTGRNYIKRETGWTAVPVYDCRHNQGGTCKNPGRTIGSGRVEDSNGEPVDFKGHFKSFEKNKHKPCDKCRRDGYNRDWRPARWWKWEDVKLLTAGKARRAGQKFMRRYGDRFKLYEYAKDQLTVPIVEAELLRLKEQEDFLASTIIIDYADNMAPSDNRIIEERHRQNNVWGGLSALRKDWYACVVTATQTDAQSYRGDDIGMDNFSEDKRKLGHVTAAIALNQRPWEKKEGIMRVGTVVARETDFHVDDQVTVLQCLRMGKPVLGSYDKK